MMKIIAIALLLTTFYSCNKDFDCVCRDSAGNELEREVISETNEYNARTQCQFRDSNSSLNVSCSLEK